MGVRARPPRLAHIRPAAVLNTPGQIDAQREQARERGLRRSDLDPDPIAQFAQWYEEVGALTPFDATAVALATATPDAEPSVRYVLLKEGDHRGFVFFTNYDSPKARDLVRNPKAALVFGWHALARQVRVAGPVERVAVDESDAYWATRPRGSQLGAWASPQSEVIPDRAALERRLAELVDRFGEDDIPRPESWGGYRLVPQTIEFWQSRADRLHDRFRYSRAAEDRWIIERIAP